ncbi:hypothetical protein EC179550_4813 [Escherichia coli 179550]|nr:hypothetical protein EC179550_4813 [Escherichia coli 179550]
MASSTTGRFSSFHRASRGDRFPSHQAKAARLAGQQRLTGVVSAADTRASSATGTDTATHRDASRTP